MVEVDCDLGRCPETRKQVMDLADRVIDEYGAYINWVIAGNPFALKDIVTLERGGTSGSIGARKSWFN